MIKKQMLENIDESVSEMESVTPEVKQKKGTLKRLGSKRIALIILVLVAIGGLYGSFHFYDKYKALTVDPNIEAKKQTDLLVSTLSKLMELPKGETPTVATISDKTKLSNQQFFKMAENGDVLFAYTTSMQAILYRPSTNKIVNVAPININQPQDITQGTTKPTTATAPKKP